MCINSSNTIDFERPSSTGWSAQGFKRASRKVAGHQHLFFEGDVRTHVFVIETGWVKLYRTLIDGQRQVVGFCNGGSILGLEGAEAHVNGCETITPVTVREIPISRLSEICAREPRLAGQLLQQMGRQLETTQAQLTTVGAQSAQQKLATFLLAFAKHGDADEFDLPMRRAEMGEFLGLRLETVSRKMSEFQERKWIRMVSLYRCRILNRDLLECLAEGGDEEDVATAHMIN
jgi:CRP/FNR family transcriptional regulator